MAEYYRSRSVDPRLFQKDLQNSGAHETYSDSEDEVDAVPVAEDFTPLHRPKTAYRFRTPVFDTSTTYMRKKVPKTSRIEYATVKPSRPRTAGVFYTVGGCQPRTYWAAEDGSNKAAREGNPYKSITDELDKLEGVPIAPVPSYSAPYFSTHNRAQRFSRLSVPKFQPNKDPIYRSGKGGGPWRHVQACYNNGGSHLCFINGTVKLDDTLHYPPYGYPEITSQLEKFGGPLYASESVPAKQTIQGKMFAKGVPLG